MTIPKKLGFSFLAINVCAVLVMAVFLVNILMIRATTDGNNLSQSILAKVLLLETSVLRQNSQFRGYLVTGDESYLKSYYEGQEDYDLTSKELEGLLTDPARIELLKQSRSETEAWRQNWGDRLIDVVKTTGREEAAEEVRAAGKAVLVSNAVLPLRDLRTSEEKTIEQNSSRQEMAIFIALIALGIGTTLLIGLAVSLARILSRSIARPLTEMTQVMGSLAEGSTNVSVPEVDRSDELGDMARAVLVFRDAAVAKAAADAEQSKVVTALGEGLEAMAVGDMTFSIDEPFAPEYERLRQTFNETVVGLDRSLSQVASSAQSVHTGSSEIRAASEDLARRTEQQAASIEETAASTQTVTSMVANTAKGTTEVRATVRVVHKEAADGSQTVRQAVIAMDEIEKSSQEIGQIVNLIDGIAFQTNLLALNAGVEAARAGEAGKGFAVVANEVRALSQRSADAAQTIKQLITKSTHQVTSGVTLVAETGKMLDSILAKIGEVTTVIGDMAGATEVQSANLQQVNDSISDMDRMTQQNAAMVEQTTACARSLASEADQLAGLITHFRLRSTQQHMIGRGPSPVVRIESAPSSRRSAAPMVVGNTAMKADNAAEDWSEF